MRKDGFLRCYMEAFAIWIGGNVLMAIVDSASVALGWSSDPLNRTSADRLIGVFDPFFLIASSVIIVPLFAAILVGSRRELSANHD